MIPACFLLRTHSTGVRKGEGDDDGHLAGGVAEEGAEAVADAEAHADAGDAAERKERAVLHAEVVDVAEGEEEEEEEGGVAQGHQQVVLARIPVGIVQASVIWRNG